MDKQSIFPLLIRLWDHLNLSRRRQLILLLILMLITALAEILSIGSIFPYLGVLVSPEIFFSHPFFQPVIEKFELTKPAQLLLPLTVLFVVAAVMAGIMRAFLLWASISFSYSLGAELSTSVYARTLYQPYTVHCSRNSSEVINGITNHINKVIDIISMLLILISACVILACSLFALLMVEPIVGLTVIGGLGSIYICIIKLTRKRLIINSRRMAYESNNVIQILQEGLGGIRDVLIDGSQAERIKVYQVADLNLRRAQGNTSFIAASPRFGVEAFGMLFIALLAYELSKQGSGFANVIPFLGALAMGAQRLLPVLQQAYSSWSGIRGGQISLIISLQLLDQPFPINPIQSSVPELSFEHDIFLNKIGFRYDEFSPYVLKQINLKIVKGARIGFIGVTGSGKSTLLDIIMGLLHPTEGKLEVDGQIVTSANCRSWQSRIAHVPQDIFLTDSTVLENIAFGVPKDKIDFERVVMVAQQAQIADVISSWPNKYQTKVGERGVRLSGGQRQRIGIARALYRQADIIIFDEATSALDSETERAIMHTIETLPNGITMLIVAHRVSTLKYCSQIVELGSGEVRRIGSYADIIK